MTKNVDYLLAELKDPAKEMELVRKGLKTTVVESFMAEQNLVIKDVLASLDISSSTYFAKKKAHQPLDPYSTEKFIRLISALEMAVSILGKADAHDWFNRKIPSLGNATPLSLLDTEVGHRLVMQALLQIKHGMYS